MWARLAGCFVSLLYLPLVVFLQGTGTTGFNPTAYVAALVSSQGLAALLGQRSLVSQLASLVRKTE
jgi:hypothetical protein